MRRSRSFDMCAGSKLTSVGLWLDACRPYFCRCVSKCDSRLRVGQRSHGWDIGVGSVRLMHLRAQPYDDIMPVIPFLVTRWSFRLYVLGLKILNWDRYTRLYLLKCRMPGRYSGLSAWTLDWRGVRAVSPRQRGARPPWLDHGHRRLRNG